MRWWATAAALLLATSAFGQLPVREKTTTWVDLTFEDANGDPAVPSTLSYRRDDRESGLELTDDTTVTPLTPCPDGSPGCITVKLEAAANVLVGLCKDKRTKCRTNGDCPTGSTPCAASTEAFQEQVMSLHWSFPDGEARDRVVLKVQNLEFQ